MILLILDNHHFLKWVSCLLYFGGMQLNQGHRPVKDFCFGQKTELSVCFGGKTQGPAAAANITDWDQNQSDQNYLRIQVWIPIKMSTGLFSRHKPKWYFPHLRLCEGQRGVIFHPLCLQMSMYLSVWEYVQALTFLFFTAVFGCGSLFLNAEAKQVGIVLVFEGDHSGLQNFWHLG